MIAFAGAMRFRKSVANSYHQTGSFTVRARWDLELLDTP